jgi:hypothetical protein
MANLTSAGAVFLAQAAINDSPTFFSSGVNAYLGVGSGGGTAFAIGQTDLITPLAPNPRKVATVTRASGVLTFVATYATTDAIGVWSEVGIFNTSSGGTMLARKVESPDLGTKPNTQTWVLTVTATFTAA